ncbi:MAG: hydrogenase nickel incorporation protein HypB [Desulfuromonadales bacterium]|nr:hydrogenase nickel incorporation protein HypB [Desulfuromonadales bacterium]MBN2791849.1 hydrogenase nickel incorporation protein HypB [Desulfuromonadales bacterium]
MERTEDYLENKSKKTVESLENLLQSNDDIAAETRHFLDQRNIRGINIMGSPGSGKTTLLENLIAGYAGNPEELAVLEGDLETNRDAERIRNRGVQAHQICTGSVCHLSAAMVSDALRCLNLDPVRYLFIENVGNLVCPSKFALGSHLNIVAVSIPEGDDKPVKYPVMIRTADIVLLTKIDLLPYFSFDEERCRAEIAAINPHARIFTTATDRPDDFSTLWGLITSA